MAISLRITSEPSPQPDDIAAVRAGLSAYNRQHVSDDSYQPINLFVRDAQETIVGGLRGGTIWKWLYVEILWISEEIRAQGYGSQLLSEAERIAIERGCIGAQLDTLSFQALPFYERHGYAVFGVLENFPPGHRKYFLQKPLA